MPEAFIWKVSDAVFGLSLVDTAEVGYSQSWQAPGGKTITTAVIADYDTGDPESEWRCQISSAGITATPSTTTETIAAVMCGPSREEPAPGATSFGLDVTFYQDGPLPNSLLQYLFENDAKPAYVFVGYNGEAGPPKVIGRVTLAAATIGGPMGTALSSTLTLPFSGKPSIAWPADVVAATADTGDEEEDADAGDLVAAP